MDLVLARINGITYGVSKNDNDLQLIIESGVDKAVKECKLTIIMTDDRFKEIVVDALDMFDSKNVPQVIYRKTNSRELSEYFSFLQELARFERLRGAFFKDFKEVRQEPPVPEEGE